MAALDTNVLVRFLVKDDATQLASAVSVIEKAAASGNALFIPVTVTLELEWVLRSNFGFGKAAVLQVLAQLLASIEPSFQEETAVELALLLYGARTADFSDCMHVALAASAGAEPLWTFDRAASRLDGARLVPG